MSNAQVLKSLDLLKSGNLQVGPDMDAAHEICQEHEGSPLFDWVHALIHRIEGDDGNAAYWYRRAGRTRHAGSVEEEWRTIRSAVDSAQSA